MLQREQAGAQRSLERSLQAQFAGVHCLQGAQHGDSRQELGDHVLRGIIGGRLQIQQGLGERRPQGQLKADVELSLSRVEATRQTDDLDPLTAGIQLA